MVHNSFRLNRGVRFVLTLVLTLNLVLGTTLMAMAAPIPDSESGTPSRAPSANDVISPFPILDPFIYTEAPNFIFGGPPSKPAAYLTAGFDDPDGEGWLRLTNNDNQQGGYALYNKAFPSDSGIAVRFQYASYGGTGADGIAFFLLDGVVDRPVISEHLGGTLGYSDYGQYTPADKYGLTKGYVGIGFDEFGNYSTPSHGGPPSAPGFRPQSVTLRGSGDGYVGYDYLTHVQLTGGKTIDDAPRDDPRMVEITIIDEIIN
ncbi:MAG: hypothetical protein JW981_04030, partial [Anaerolineae bacterium]|nr:hypothetical protein [Anaerolineae bacterium]